jgi:hypothetical protein
MEVFFPGVKQAGNNIHLRRVSRIRISGATPLFPCADTPELNTTFTLRKLWLKSELSIDTLNYICYIDPDRPQHDRTGACVIAQYS